MTIGQACVLYDRSCMECGECNLCDLNPQKVCDNCCECLETSKSDYAEIVIDDILMNIEDIQHKDKK